MKKIHLKLGLLNLLLLLIIHVAIIECFSYHSHQSFLCKHHGKISDIFGQIFSVRQIMKNYLQDFVARPEELVCGARNSREALSVPMRAKMPGRKRR